MAHASTLASDYAACLFNLAVLYLAKGEYARAEPLCQLLYGADYRPAGLTLTVLFIGN